eukprot:SAG11_NODE_2848_length_2909_cov_10.989324_1_plen_71_part_00
MAMAFLGDLHADIKHEEKRRAAVLATGFVGGVVVGGAVAVALAAYFTWREGLAYAERQKELEVRNIAPGQ